jgi:hypothetical protein
MRISDRLTDYVVVGGFFWIALFTLTSVMAFGVLRWTNPVTAVPALMENVPDKAITPLVALLGALTIVIVFTTGVFLDLLAGYFFRGEEMRVFQSHAKKNDSWMHALVARNEDYIQTDWATILSAPGRLMEEASAAQSKAHAEAIKAGLEAYTRMHAFFLSWVFLKAGANKIEWLSNQMSVWSISRTAAMAVAIIGILTLPVPVFVMVRYGLPGGPAAVFRVLLAVLALVVQLLLLFTSSKIARAAYSRVCDTVFALFYIASKALEDHGESEA